MTFEEIQSAINAAFRDYVVSGVPASGAHEPVKQEVRAALALLVIALDDGGFDAPPNWANSLADVQSKLEDIDAVVAGLATVTSSAAQAVTARNQAVAAVDDALEIYGSIEAVQAVEAAAAVSAAQAQGALADALEIEADGSDAAAIAAVGARAPVVGTRAFAETLNIPAGLFSLRTSGFAVAGDGGDATYDRWAVPMAALPAGGEGIWWFESADGAQWQIAPASQHMAAAFGALGGAGIDARPIINEAFLAPMVREINLGALTHYVSLPGVRPASGKNLVGINRTVSWVRVIPVAVLTTGQNFAVGRINDDGGLCRDYSIDCQRSHFGIGTHGHPHGHVIYAKAGGSCRRTNVVRVDVHNCYGYAHYTTTGPGVDGLVVEDTRREDCRSFNFNVGFEETGNVVRHVNVRPVAIAAAQDGGSLLTAECLFHQYGDIQDVVYLEPYGRGTVQSGVQIFNVEGKDIEKVHYINPDIDVTGDVGLFVEARNAAGTNNPADGVLNAINDVQVIGGRIRTTRFGGIVSGAKGKTVGTEFVGLNGPGLELRANADLFELHAPILEANRNPAGGTAAVALVINGAARPTWYGSGKMRAIGPASSAPADLSLIDFYGTPELFPTRGDIDLVITDKLFRVPFASWINTDTPGQNYRVDIDLSGLNSGSGVRDIAKTIVVPTLEIPFPGGAVGANFAFSMEMLWISTQTVRVYIITTAVLTGCVLKARVTEYA